MKSGIYQIQNLINGKVYIGSAVNLNFRKSLHIAALKRNRHCNLKLQNAFNKYGEKNFEFSVIQFVEDLMHLIKYEQFYMDIYDVVKHGYNICPIAGSTLNRIFSEATKQKMRIKALSRDKTIYQKIYTPERNAEISKALSGKKRPEEVKQKMSNALIGKTWIERFGKQKSDEIISKIKLKNTGQKRPKQSAAMKGKLVGDKNPMFGKKHSDDFKKARKEFLTLNNPGKNKSEETKMKISQAKKGKSGHLHTEEYKFFMSNKMTEIWAKRKAKNV